ncbi:hypothetical protein BDP27DRAFT_587039 [Rhodocollybia butyracea]|uniref:DUF6533 domain-containing protein n=1 Tax=Rhodocollybia butyracea TaxID=206335 RepID=A0A9P5TX53_9AGAR|nr:hypothetical protein BDP27DRAFT_587039 [Rhodocollybia butyracea]
MGIHIRSTGPSDVLVQVQWNVRVELVSFAILFYDYLTTLDLEVEYFWNGSSRGLGTILFYINRYLSLLGNIPIIIFFFWPEPLLRSNRCHALEIYQQFFLSLVQLVISILFILRLYAIYAHDKRVLTLLCILTTGMVGNGLLQWYISQNDAAVLDIPQALISQAGCLQSYTSAQGLHMVYLWLGVLVVDLIVFSLTLRKTLQLFKDIPGGIVTVIMRDGVLYFGIITLTNSANILAFALGKDYMKGLLPIFANIIASVMMSHLMLNLRDGQVYSMEVDLGGPPKLLIASQRSALVFKPWDTVEMSVDVYV